MLPRQLGERHHQHLPPVVNSSCQVRHAHWCNSGRTVTVITRHLQTVSEVHSMGGSSRLELCTWSEAHDLVTDRRGTSIAFILPNGHAIKLSPKYSCVQPYVTLTRGFFFFWRNGCRGSCLFMVLRTNGC